MRSIGVSWSTKAENGIVVVLATDATPRGVLRIQMRPCTGAWPGAAQALGHAMAQRGVGLVYGAAQVGLMGAVADAVLAAGQEVIGVIPEALMDAEVAPTSSRGWRWWPTCMSARAHDRTGGHGRPSGGLGTLEELFEALTWLQLPFTANPAPCSMWTATTTLFFSSWMEPWPMVSWRRASPLLSVHRDPQQLLDELFPHA